MVDRGLMSKLDRAGLARVRSANAVADELPAGVRMLDRWRSGEDGAVLFWVGPDLDPWGFGQGTATLHLVEARQVDGEWRNDGGGGWGAFTAAEYIAMDGVGLHRLGGSSGGTARLTIAVASREVSSIELRAHQGVTSRPPGADGFCLLGITAGDPVTRARPFARDGEPVGSATLLL